MGALLQGAAIAAGRHTAAKPPLPSRGRSAARSLPSGPQWLLLGSLTVALVAFHRGRPLSPRGGRRHLCRQSCGLGWARPGRACCGRPGRGRRCSWAPAPAASPSASGTPPPAAHEMIVQTSHYSTRDVGRCEEISNSCAQILSWSFTERIICALWCIFLLEMSFTSCSDACDEQQMHGLGKSTSLLPAFRPVSLMGLAGPPLPSIREAVTNSDAEQLMPVLPSRRRRSRSWGRPPPRQPRARWGRRPPARPTAPLYQCPPSKPLLRRNGVCLYRASHTGSSGRATQ